MLKLCILKNKNNSRVLIENYLNYLQLLSALEFR